MASNRYDTGEGYNYAFKVQTIEVKWEGQGGIVRVVPQYSTNAVPRGFVGLRVNNSDSVFLSDAECDDLITMLEYHKKFRQDKGWWDTND